MGGMVMVAGVEALSKGGSGMEALVWVMGLLATFLSGLLAARNGLSFFPHLCFSDS